MNVNKIIFKRFRTSVPLFTLLVLCGHVMHIINISDGVLFVYTKTRKYKLGHWPTNDRGSRIRTIHVLRSLVMNSLF